MRCSVLVGQLGLLAVALLAIALNRVDRLGPLAGRNQLKRDSECRPI